MLQQYQQTLNMNTFGQGLVDITHPLQQVLDDSAFVMGQMTVFIRHTSASLTIQENADPTVQSDLVTAFDRLAPESGHLYDHTLEGPDDMPAHIKSALTDVSLTIPFAQGVLGLGRWQGVYIFEHRRQPHRRSVVCHLIGSTA